MMSLPFLYLKNICKNTGNLHPLLTLYTKTIDKINMNSYNSLGKFRIGHGQESFLVHNECPISNIINAVWVFWLWII